MQIPQPRIKWQVILSNGQTLKEGEGEIVGIVDGEKSPWLKLSDYLRDNKVGISGICLVGDDGKEYRLPFPKTDPKMAKFESGETPIGFNFFRMFGTDLVRDPKPDYYSIIEAQYASYKLQLWVDEYTKNCWCVVK